MTRAPGNPRSSCMAHPPTFARGSRSERGSLSKYRFVAHTQRYFGTEPWPDDGKNFSIATLANDLATFITSLNAGPVHLVGWSYGGAVAMQAAVKNPSLVRSLILYEPAASSPCCQQIVPRENRRAKINPR